jgi:hypothetical protein
MQLHAVNLTPPPNSLYMFRAAHTPIIRRATVSTATGMVVPVAVDTVVLLMMGVCAARNM